MAWYLVSISLSTLPEILCAAYSLCMCTPCTLTYWVWVSLKVFTIVHTWGTASHTNHQSNDELQLHGFSLYENTVKSKVVATIKSCLLIYIEFISQKSYLILSSVVNFCCYLRMYMQETDHQDLYTALIYFQSKLKNDISECCLYMLKLS